LAQNGGGNSNLWPIPNFAKFLSTNEIGIGEGYKLGIESASSEWILLSASDLPFEFSDLMGARESFEIADLYIGSKLHRLSKIDGRGPLRFLASWGFYSLRRILFGESTPLDTQGTVLVRTNDAKAILKEVRSRGFFFSTEFILIAQTKGLKIAEVPVRALNSRRSSSVKVGRDGATLFLKSLELKRRLRALGKAGHL
jgi:hypothetical protein